MAAIAKRLARRLEVVQLAWRRSGAVDVGVDGAFEQLSRIAHAEDLLLLALCETVGPVS